MCSTGPWKLVKANNPIDLQSFMAHATFWAACLTLSSLVRDIEWNDHDLVHQVLAQQGFQGFETSLSVETPGKDSISRV
jgi:hypothetical protein